MLRTSWYREPPALVPSQATGPYCTDIPWFWPFLWTSYLTVQNPLGPTLQVVTSSGQNWRPVQTCSLFTRPHWCWHLVDAVEKQVVHIPLDCFLFSCFRNLITDHFVSYNNLPIWTKSSQVSICSFYDLIHQLWMMRILDNNKKNWNEKLDIHINPKPWGIGFTNFIDSY